jgi:D-alanyl-lipoteichoic acid acyltransferase DltB (MBOAT superfamily)
MVFNSVEFAIFLPIVLGVYAFIYQKNSARDVWLLLCSYVFYMFSYWKYAGLIGFSTIIDYTIALRMQKETDPRIRKLLVVLSVTVNLSILGVFKYYNFFAESTSQALAAYGIDTGPVFHHLVLPAGISFYTFQSLSYTIDVYRKKIDAERNFIRFAAFIAFFPQLVAGPIVRAADFLPQLHKRLTIDSAMVSSGITLILVGLFKKIVFADLLALLAVDAVFKQPTAYSSFDLLMALYGYAFQIYCDFSGYTDIAIGTALLFGLHLTLNFDKPYLSQSPSEFWKRWHISLSSWLRDYLYIPLGGNRGSELFTMRNLMITMVLGGLWHGAATHFVLWGFYHGALLVLYRVMDNAGINAPVPPLVKRIFFFHLIVLGWLIFRVPDMQSFTTYLHGLAQLSMGTQFSALYFLVLAAACVAHFVPYSVVERITQWNQTASLPVRSAAYAALLLVFFALSINSSAFIYFQF